VTDNKDVIDDKVLDRIKKLLALAEANPNEHEASIAMERAQRLLAKYNLSIADLPKDQLDKSDPYVRMDERYGAMKGPVAGRSIAAAIAKLYFCKMFYVNIPNRGDIISFVGRTTNAEVAKMVSRTVIESLKLEARKGKHLPGFETNFMIAAANRICRRVHDLIEEAKAGQLKETDNVGEVKNLPALLETYKAEEERTEAFLKQEVGKLRETRRGSRGGAGDYGFAEGREAGNRVSLRPEVGGKKRDAIERRD
jgi:hypothetical protein